ncbi:MAG: dihydrolipoyl dehydrogenase [Alphaproteobacteria bacterium]
MAGDRDQARTYDVVVIGGGPGGYVAAVRAAQLGLSTAVVEAEALGGICLNWGCIPTKALLRAAELRHQVGALDSFGISVGEVKIDLARLVARSREVAARLSKGVAFLMKKNKIEVVSGHGRLDGPGRVRVTLADGGDMTLQAGHIILATGARARQLPDLQTDGDKVWSYREAMVPEALPRSLLVIGSGAIGMEFASFYNDLGVDVHVVEVLDRVLPVEDPEVSALVAKSFARRGVEIITGASVAHLNTAGSGVTATIEQDGDSRELTVERALLSIGITGNVEELGLEGTAVQVERGHVVVDEWLRTAEPDISAIGDLVGPPWLAHKAMHEGVLCVERIAGVEGLHPLSPGDVPGCTYCRPQVASVGLTEAAATEAGHDVRVGRFPLQANGKAIALGDEEGFVKTVFDGATGALLGAHMVGPEVTEMIQGYAIARTLETTEAELIRTIFPHPTVSESMHEAVLDAFDRALHI